MRHVVAALPRQASARRKVPERRVRGPRQRAVDPTLARIVRRDRERPVAVVPVEEAKVARRRARRARGVGPVVALRVDDQAEAPRRRGAELPEAELAESSARTSLHPLLEADRTRVRTDDSAPRSWPRSSAARLHVPIPDSFWGGRGPARHGEGVQVGAHQRLRPRQPARPDQPKPARFKCRGIIWPNRPRPGGFGPGERTMRKKGVVKGR